MIHTSSSVFCFRHVFFYGVHFCRMCFIRSENHITGNRSLLLFSAAKGKDHIRTGHEGPEVGRGIALLFL